MSLLNLNVAVLLIIILQIIFYASEINDIAFAEFGTKKYSKSLFILKGDIGLIHCWSLSPAKMCERFSHLHNYCQNLDIIAHLLQYQHPNTYHILILLFSLPIIGLLECFCVPFLLYIVYSLSIWLHSSASL